MKKLYLLLPLLTFMLASCGEVRVPNQQIPNTDTNQNNDKPDEGNKPDSNPNEGETTPDTKPDGGETTPDTKPDDHTKPDGGETTPDTKPDDHTKPDGGETTPDTKPGKLPNGRDKIEAPTNLNNPLDATEWQNFDCTSSVPENWKFIYGNNATAGEFYVKDGENIALKFAEEGRGIQTPALVPAKKHEVRLHVSEVHGGRTYKQDETKETFLIYGFDKNSDVVYENYLTPYSKGVDIKNTKKFDLKFYVENINVSYIEIRINDRMYDNTPSKKYFNFGCDSLSVKSYNW